MQLLGKLAPSGLLTEIYYRDPIAWQDGSTDVLLVSMPIFDGPYAYDAVNKAATANPAAAAQLLNAQRVQQMSADQWNNVRCYVPNDVTTTLATFTDIIGAGFPIGPGETWNAEFKLFCLGSAAGVRIQVTGPANPVRAVAGFDGNTTSPSLRSFNPKASAFENPSIIYVANATPFTGLIVAYLNIVNGPNPGVVQLQVASATAGQINKIIAGSFGDARRAA